MADDLNALVTREAEREIRPAVERLAKAEAELAQRRATRDAFLAHCYDFGVPIAVLARDAEISRQTVYQAIRRHHKTRSLNGR